jgi:hypothetical protein
MGTSLAAGVAALPDDAEAVLVLLGDEPDVSPDIVRRLVQSYLANKAAITVPMYGDQVGPPTLFSRELFADLAALQGDVGGNCSCSIPTRSAASGLPMTNAQRTSIRRRTWRECTPDNEGQGYVGSYLLHVIATTRQPCT